MTIRTRFAPSPTGYMHLGNLRSALYTYLFARHNGGVFVLRIEDTDQNRYVEGATDVIYRTLRGIGIDWDEGPDVGGDYGPYVQSERKGMYLPYARRLVETGKAYYCFCTNEELDARREEAAARGETYKYGKHCLHLSKEEVQAKLDAGEPYVIRQNVPEQGEASFDDLIYGRIAVDCADLDDQILIKADGMPTYNFANVVDDHTMAVTHVMRGNEYLASTPKYNLLYDAFGWEKPVYIHLTSIMRDATHKLSKRTGDAYYEDYIAKGYLKDAILNYVALLGWNPGDEREFFTLPELVEAFSLKGLSKSPAIFDPNKLTWMNAEYIRRLAPEQYTKEALPWYERAGVAGMDLEVLRRILQPRTEVFGQLPEMVDFLVKLDEGYDIELFTNKKSKTDAEVSRAVLDMVLPALAALPDWTEAALHDALIGMAEANGMKNGTLLWPVRIALAGRAVTPGGAIEIAYLLGRDEALRRLALGRQKLS
ncbi:MAG: Glutamate--tRNA ligase [Firmicutes bacterium ADurb.Bin248]|nr:MAG: Glutamate--tRNA ligase [Firmicutes bacterium ADurb.Bin248]HOG01562.1 glutamate--tRNA ligase [Clostridia bacterium]HPK14641.1 glutamate--tRNA ligase [Clostridia bacterium]